jgi:hypothetical protein
VGCNYISSKLKRNKQVNNQEDNRIQKKKKKKRRAKDLAFKSQHLIENFMASSEDTPKIMVSQVNNQEDNRKKELQKKKEKKKKKRKKKKKKKNKRKKKKKKGTKDLAFKSQHLIENFMASSEDTPQKLWFHSR